MGHPVSSIAGRRIRRSIRNERSANSFPVFGLLVGEFLQLMAPVERLNEAFRFAPARLDDDVELEIHARAQQRFDLLARPGADFLQLRSALADEDGLLAIALAVDDR